MTRTPVILIHGPWLHALSWQSWADRFTSHGFDVIAPGWPGEPATVGEARRLPETLRPLGLDALTDHYARIVRSCATPPVIIGHSVGGLVAQHLLGAGLGRAAVAIAPAPIAGTLVGAPLTTASTERRGRSSAPGSPAAGSPVPGSPAYDSSGSGSPAYDSSASGSPASGNRAGEAGEAGEAGPVMLSAEQFHDTFANAVPEEESTELFRHYVIPSSRRLLSDLGEVDGVPHPRRVVDTGNAERGPLLLVSGQEDRMVPDDVTRAVYKLYGDSTAPSDLKQFPDRAHSLTIDKGWRAVADHVLAWLAGHGIHGDRS
ncbi:alpha/beta fold hydrolase [Streptomyces sp. NPDC056161]|uniref:alpha/beta fold hydrolase n=1 Tax=Streptomyces sp. NPDC056161 TaxID=3345732 RepID=UPI0035D783B9